MKARTMFEHEEHGELTYTKSRLRMWWLRSVKGYAIASVSRTPKVVSFGQIAYTTRWSLEPPHRTQTSSKGKDSHKP